MRKPWSEDGDESLKGTFIIIATFLLLSAFVIANMGTTFSHADRGYFTQYEGEEIIGGRIIETNQTTPVAGYAVTPNNITDRTITLVNTFNKNSVSKVFRWQDTDLDRGIWAVVVRNNIDYDPDAWALTPGREEAHAYEDCIFFSSYRGWTWKYSAISFDNIVSKYVQGANLSMVDFKLGNNRLTDVYTLIVNTTGSSDTFAALLFADIFTMKLGVPAFTDDPELAKTSMWAMLWQLFTASIPGVNIYVNTIVSFPFWAAMGFMAFTLISRVIPFISGG